MQDGTGERPIESTIPISPSRPTRIVASEDLLQGAREIVIQHGTEHYRLRLTRAGKLILNK